MGPPISRGISNPFHDPLGFTIKKEKCSQEPTQQIVFLGAHLNTETMTLSLPLEKLETIIDCAQTLHSSGKGTLATVVRLLGQMNHAAQTGMDVAPLFYRQLQAQVIAVVHKWGFRRHHTIQLSAQALQDLNWWLSRELHHHNGTPIHKPKIDLTVHTDASLQGWGGTCEGVSIGGRWGPGEASLHINVLELRAAFLALQAFLRGRSPPQLM